MYQTKNCSDSVRFRTPRHLLLIVTFFIFISELLVMYLLDTQIKIPLSHSLIDSSFLTFLLLPSLYYFFYKPLTQYISEKNLAEMHLKEINNTLEEKVAERTAQLEELNQIIKKEYTQALEASEALVKSTLNGINLGMTVISPSMEIVSTNDQIKLWHPNVEPGLKQICYMTLPNPPLESPCPNCPVQKTLSDGKNHQDYLELETDGQKRYMRIMSSPVKDKDGKIISVVEIVEDYTDIKISEEALKEVEEKAQIITNAAKDAIMIIDNKRTITFWNPAAAEIFGYSKEQAIGKDVKDLLVHADNYSLFDSNFMWMEAGNPTNKTFEILAVKNSGDNFPIELSISTYKQNGKCHAVGIVRDITERKRAEQEILITERTLSEKALMESYDQLKQTLEETVNALVAVTEKRDPYTAGHQHRVAELACAIAKEMDLSEEQLEGIYNAGKLHDIGKIYVPTDILNKPGKLSEMEFAIIKTHSEVSYDILSKIPFKCPVADIVIQHHERIDGSGYPCQLTEEDILIEAKILAVADVIEAMASHRPYRPTLGLESALAEITKNKGVLYDPLVVDATFRLFNKNQAAFKKLLA